MFKLLFNIGQQLRNPSLIKHLEFLKVSEKWSLKELEAYQLEKLKELVCVAKENSPYFKRLLNQKGIVKIESLDDLKKIPITSKKELLAFNKDIHTNLELNKFFTANTSGTSGEALKFKREERADSFNRASIFRGYSWYNVKPWYKNGYFWGFNFTSSEKIKTKVLDLFQHRFRMFSYKNNELDLFVTKLQKASYLHGYSSMIYRVAKYINEHQLPKPIHLKMVKGTSEKIMDSYQAEVQKAFGLKMINEYGAAETGIIAFECPFGNMHINMEGVIVEEIENEIIVTNLQMHSFPIIRYKLGDYIKLSKTTDCKCGMKHTIIEEITGRVGNIVYGKAHEYPSLYFYYVFKNLAKINKLYLNYQISQDKKGELNIAVEQCLTNVELNLLQNELEKYFKNDMECVILHSKNIQTNSKKHKSFISTI
ncbi:phenylacetate-CoA ligase [Lutibacter oricola]|uniref:Phenylacetate-CoA ligase n=1 Tax=Lutibacter oricola TaxID=762486 RepID=A0A1H2X298_9FLAO|nr:phenylacetate--CoA ligase family protein [Lutibacter oricola]SDW86866.1 phenylacetate-CoA ligase [Lutibacter oricola]